MAGKSTHFRCPFCNMHAPLVHLEEGPYQFGLFEKIMGGKVKLTIEEKEKQISRGYTRFHVPGVLDYEPTDMTQEALTLAKKRQGEVAQLELFPED